MRIDELLLLYVLTSLGLLGLLALITAWRQHSFRPTPTPDNIFWCRKCNYVYTDDADVDRSRCPQCGTFNEPVRF